MLDLYPNLIAITFVSFVLLIFILNKILYRPIVNFMDTREESIQNDISNASKNENAINDAQNEVNANLDEARKEADSLRQEAVKQAQQQQEKELQSLREELDVSYAKFIDELEVQKNTSRQEILSKAPALKEKFSQKLSSI